jgi:hypothetical protein
MKAVKLPKYETERLKALLREQIKYWENLYLCACSECIGYNILMLLGSEGQYP